MHLYASWRQQHQGKPISHSSLSRTSSWRYQNASGEGSWACINRNSSKNLVNKDSRLFLLSMPLNNSRLVDVFNYLRFLFSYQTLSFRFITWIEPIKVSRTSQLCQVGQKLRNHQDWGIAGFFITPELRHRFTFRLISYNHTETGQEFQELIWELRKGQGGGWLGIPRGTRPVPLTGQPRTETSVNEEAWCDNRPGLTSVRHQTAPETACLLCNQQINGNTTPVRWVTSLSNNAIPLQLEGARDAVINSLIHDRWAARSPFNRVTKSFRWNCGQISEREDYTCQIYMETGRLSLVRLKTVRRWNQTYFLRISRYNI